MTTATTVRLSVALALAVTLALAGCERAAGGTAPRDDPPPTYYLQLEIVDLWGQATVLSNGFPVYVSPGGRLSDDGPLPAPLQTALVSGRNTAAVQIDPFVGRSGDAPVVGPVRLRGSVTQGYTGGWPVVGAEVTGAAVDAAFAAWEVELRSRWAGWLAAEDSLFETRPALLAALVDSAASDPEAAAYGVGPAADSARAWAARNPVVVETSFARPGGASPSDGAPSFDAVLRDAPVIAGTAADSARLRAFAVRLRDLTAARDTAAVFDAFRPSLADAFAAGGGAEGVGEDSASFMASVRTRIVMDGVVPFGAGDVGLRSWAGGRVWELYRGEAGGLLEPPDRSTFRKVFVGEGPDGALRVVR